MRNIIIGTVIGLVIGAVLGIAYIEPRLEPEAPAAATLDMGATARSEPAGLIPRRVVPRLAVRMNLASAFSSGTPLAGALALRLEDEIREVSSSEMEIIFHEPGTLVPVADMLGAVRSQSIDAAFATPGMWSEDIPGLSLFSGIPFGPRAEEFLAWYYAGGGRALLQALYQERGVHSVVCGIIPSEAGGWFRSEITEPAELRGLRVRADGLGAEVLARLGVETVDLNGGEIFAALEDGALDGVVYSTPAVDLQLGFHQFAPNYYFPGWQSPVRLLVLIMALETWRDLDPTQQAWIEAVCGDNVRFALAQSEAQQFTALKQLYGSGVRLRRWSEPMLSALEDTWDALAAEKAEADAGFRDVWQSLQTFRTEYAIWNEINGP